MTEQQNSKNLKKNKQVIIIAIVIVLLIGAVAVLAALNNQGNDKIKEGDIWISLGNGATMYTQDAVKDFKTVSFDKEIKSGSHDDESGTFTGIPLENIFDEQEPNWKEEHKNFVCIASDGFTVAISKEDILKGENVILVYEKDGKDLIPGSKDGPGPYRIIVKSDPFGNRSIRNVDKIIPEENLDAEMN